LVDSRPALRTVSVTFTFADVDLLDVLAALAAAGTRAEVAEAVCRVLVELDGVRGVAVATRMDDVAVVRGSAGYPCDTMGPGARLPLDGGLPLVEAVRTGQLVRTGSGPGWVAVPFGRRTTSPGALLLSLTSAPPSAEPDLARLRRLATAVGDALQRAESADRAATDLATLVAGLRGAGHDDDGESALRQLPRDGVLGGDVLLSVSEPSGDRWLVAADVCGSGLPAATGAAAVRTAVRALVPLASGPAHLLSLLDAALRPEAPDGGFVTAVVVQVGGGRLRAASAGHPPPVLVTASGAAPLPVEPGAPLALETTAALPLLTELDVATEPGLVVLYTDGLTDRRGPAGVEMEVLHLLAAVDAGAAIHPTSLADGLLAAAAAAGPAADDTSVLVSRI
jgi:hypothetical protein